MSKLLKSARYLGYAIFALLIPAAVILLLLLNSCFFKHRLEQRSSESFALDIKIEGAVSPGFSHGLQIAVHDLHMRKNGEDLAVAGKLEAGIDLWPLLRGEIRVNSIAARDIVVSAVRYEDGSYNFTRPHPHVTPKLARLDITNANIRFSDKMTAVEYSAARCNAELLALTPVDRPVLENPGALDISATLSCEEIHRNDFVLGSVKLALAGSNKVLRVTPLALDLFGAQGTGVLVADFNGAEPHYELNFAESQFQVEKSVALFAPGKSLSGLMDISAQLSAQGESLAELKQTLAGQVSLQGKNLVLNGIDLDEQFAKFETTQNFSLIDAGAVLLAGPLGVVATKGFDYANLSAEAGTNSEISAVVSQWNIANGTAKAIDVAMRTKQNLLALRGELDFPKGEFKNLSFALLDNMGCPRVEQAVSGSFQHPEIARPDIFSSLTGPVRALLRKLQPEQACTVFYVGSLAVPK